MTALHEAAKEGDLAQCQALIANGAAVDARDVDDEQQTPLQLAAGLGKEAVCRFLVEHGAEVNAGDYDLRTPLHGAAESNCEAICRFLVQACQADINVRDENQHTPLHLAAEWGQEYEAVCRFLVAQGAALDMKDYQDDTPIDIATSAGHTGLAGQLTRWAELRARVPQMMRGNTSHPVDVQLPIGLHPSMDQNTIKIWDGLRGISKGFISKMRTADTIDFGRYTLISDTSRAVLSFLEPIILKDALIVKINRQVWNQLKAQLDYSDDDKSFITAECLRASGTDIRDLSYGDFGRLAVHYGLEECGESNRI